MLSGNENGNNSWKKLLQLVTTLVDKKVQEMMRREGITIERLGKLREDEKCFFMFLDEFFGCIRGKKIWKHHSTRKCLQDCSTVNDEAFGILLLENYWGRWTEAYQKGVRGGQGLTTQPLYTQGGQGRGGTKKLGGWKAEGLVRFGELVNQVRLDREKNRNIDEKYLRRKKIEEEQSFLETQKSGDTTDSDKVYAPREELSDDE